MRGRRSKFTPEQKLEYVIRNLRGETQNALHEKYGVPISELQYWKKEALDAALRRLRIPIKSQPVLTDFRMLLQRISDETEGWKPWEDVKLTRAMTKRRHARKL